MIPAPSAGKRARKCRAQKATIPVWLLEKVARVFSRSEKRKTKPKQTRITPTPNWKTLTLFNHHLPALCFSTTCKRQQMFQLPLLRLNRQERTSKISYFVFRNGNNIYFEITIVCTSLRVLSFKLVYQTPEMNWKTQTNRISTSYSFSANNELIIFIMTPQWTWWTLWRTESRA